MIRERIRLILEWLKRVITQPRSELTRWQRAARFTYDLGLVGARQLRENRAPQMAAALSYRTLFGLLPVLMVATVVVGTFRGTDDWINSLAKFMEAMELDEVKIAATDGSDGTALSAWILDYAREASESINFAAVGGVGIAVVIYSAISLMVTIENSFNQVFRARCGRSWSRRLPVYWTVLTLGPIGIVLTVYLNNMVRSGEVGPAWQWLITGAPVLWTFTVSWLLLLLLYKLLPNTSVALRPALAGSFVAALVFQVGSGLLSHYFQNAMSVRQIWGSLAFIPLFMFWVYVMWMVVLFGLEVSSILQILGGRRIAELGQPHGQPTGIVDPTSVVTIMEIVTDAFEAGRPCSTREATEAAEIPEATVSAMFDALVERGLLHRLEHEDSMVTLACPPEQISADKLVEIGYGLVERGAGGRRSEIADQLRAAQQSLAARTTLRPQPPAPG